MSPCHCPNVWCPPELGPWFSNDEAGSIGPEYYAKFCAPELEALSNKFTSVGTHCCADAEHQFDQFLETPEWYAFNRVAGRQGYASLCDHSPVDAVLPVFVLGWISEEDQTLLENHFGREGRFVFYRTFDSADEAKRWLEWSHRNE